MGSRGKYQNWPFHKVLGTFGWEKTAALLMDACEGSKLVQTFKESEFSLETLYPRSDNTKTNILAKEGYPAFWDNISDSQLPKFSYFRKPIQNIMPYSEITIRQLYEVIKEPYFRKQTETLRKLNNKDEKRIYKTSQFDFACISGCFSKRHRRYCKSHSGYIVIDFDYVPNIEKAKTRLSQNLSTVMVFTSPGGKGIKWIVQIESSFEKHLVYFKGIKNYAALELGLQADESGKDISRACFIPYDPNVLINPLIIDYDD